MTDTQEKTPQQEYDEMFSRLQTDDKYAAAMAYVMKQDFLSYMVTMFYLINCQRMMLKDFHLTVIKKLQGLVDGTNEKRNLALCLPVGSGKSLLTEYFISWCFARSRDNAFVYTSHSEDLITKMSAEIRSICTFPMWQRLFGWVLKKDDRQKTNFSFEGAKNITGLRAKAINSAITGLDAGNPAVDGFSGALIADDVLDAGNAIYEIERENVIRIYNEKLATRRRTPTTPTILIMQRLHPEDLVGWVEKNQPELWDIVKVPALNPDGTSFWEERYPAEELRMLEKRQGALFQAQYQQEPVITGGSVIKTEWFKYYQQHPKYERLFMTSDTAMKANEWNDYSVLQLWGKYQNSLYLIDMIRGKWEVPDLIQKTRDFVKKYRLWENRILLSALYVEDRGSGVGLIQQLRRETPVPILPLKPNKKDKVTRAKEIAYYIESGMVFLPQDKDYSFNRELLTEVELFSADGGSKHDDIIDCITYAVTIGIAGVGSSIFDN